jgi:macrolide-specific efflux system membrane fusion protein
MTPLRTAIVIVALFLLLLGGVLAFLKPRGGIVRPVRGPVTEAVYGLGKVTSDQHFDVVTGVISTVSRVLVREGQDVKKGDPLLSLQDSVVIRSTVSGTVTLVKVKDGETLLPQTPVIRVEDLRDCYIELSLEQDAALRVRKGMAARVSFESIRNKTVPGTVIAVFPRQDEFLVHVAVSALDPGVLPGMTADVVIEIGAPREATLIPAKAVDDGMITVRRKGRWVREKIEIGYVDGTHVEVLSPPLTPEDELRMVKER